MAWLQIEPQLRDRFIQGGLTEASDFLSLQGVILGGHRHRHVQHLSAPVAGYLKKEHRVLWRDRCKHLMRCVGPVSLSAYEARMLSHLRFAGIPVPQPLAWGEANGQAFLLVKEITNCCDLRVLLTERPDQAEVTLDQLATTLAMVHDAGFTHGDLFPKHILVRPGEIFLIDWQRGLRHRAVSWQDRCRELATLDAALAPELASPAMRAQFLRRYRQASIESLPDWKTLASMVRKLSRSLFDRPRYRHGRSVVESGRQNLIWLDGEKLCITREFRERFGDFLPPWLMDATLGDTRPDADLLLKRRHRGSLWAWLTRSRKPSPEFAHAASLFLLHRGGIPAPCVLAVGHDTPGPRGRSSFLLTELKIQNQPLLQRLAASERSHHAILRNVGATLRMLHDADHRLADCDALAHPLEAWAVEIGTERVLLTSVAGLERCRKPDSERDLLWIERILGSHDAAVVRMGYEWGPVKQVDSTQGATDHSLRQSQEMA